MARPEMNIQKVLVIGAGTMGQQIAAHCHLHGFDVTVHDTNPHALDNAAEQMAVQGQYFVRYRHLLPRVIEAVKQLRVETDPQRAGRDCDLLIENVPERLKLKQELYATFDRICPPQTIFATNTSSMLPSRLAVSTGRPGQFAALHFFPYGIAAEIMGHADTDPEVLNRLESFALAIRHIPIRCLKEQQGHVFNTIYMAFISTAIGLAADGVASVHDIDRCWMEATGMPGGPFSSLDFVGLDTALDVTDFMAHLEGAGGPTRRNAEFLRQYVDRGRHGIKTNHGFYRYPNPLNRHPDFLKPIRLAELTEDNHNYWPIVKSVNTAPHGEVIATIVIDPNTCGFVRDHRFRQTPLFPMSAGIELLRYATELASPHLGPFGIRDFVIENGLRFFTDRPAQLILRLIPEGDGFSAILSHDYYNRAGKLVQANRPLATARIVPGDQRRAVPPDHTSAGQTYAVGYRNGEAIATFGPSMQGLERMVLGDRTGYGQVQCDHPLDASYTRHDLAVSAFDAALIACHGYTQQRLNGGLQLAASADAIGLGRPPRPGEACRVQFTVEEFNDKASAFNVALYGSDSEALLTVEGFRCTVLPANDPPFELTAC